MNMKSKIGLLAAGILLASVAFKGINGHGKG